LLVYFPCIHFGILRISDNGHDGRDRSGSDHDGHGYGHLRTIY
jgi:hypothetical protein